MNKLKKGGKIDKTNIDNNRTNSPITRFRK